MIRSAACSVPEVVLIGYGGAIGAVVHVEDLLGQYVQLKLQGKATHHWKMSRDFYLCSAIGVPSFMCLPTISPRYHRKHQTPKDVFRQSVGICPYYRLRHTATLRLQCMWTWHAL